MESKIDTTDDTCVHRRCKGEDKNDLSHPTMHQNNLKQNSRLVPNYNVYDTNLFLEILENGFLISEIFITEKELKQVHKKCTPR